MGCSPSPAEACAWPGTTEARRVLRPGGRFLFDAWDRIETNESPVAVQEAFAQVVPDDPPRLLERTPHGYYDGNLIRGEVLEAGSCGVEATV